MSKKATESQSVTMRNVEFGCNRNLSDEEQKKQKKMFCNNEISTTKYSLITFLPLALLYQFLRFANIYFLITAVIQSIPYVSPLHPFSAIAPLIFVLGVSLLREGLESLGRYYEDKKINNKITKIYKEGKWEDIRWKDIHVGDFIKIKNDEFFPCDLIVMTTSYINENRGTCFIETASLDGEKNMKPRLAIANLMTQVENGGLESLEGIITYQEPDSLFHNFDGVIGVNNKKYSLSAKQLLLRGASLRNTKSIIGMAVYTGHDTKVMKNTENSRYKTSKMERLMNDLILKLLILQALMYIGSVVGYVAWHWQNQDKYDALPQGFFPFAIESMAMILTYFLLYNTMLPISLIVTLDIVKIFQSFFIDKDKHFYNKEQNCGCRVMTRSINEELGQVQYVFSDKTGTLTRNIMELKYFTIGSNTYTGFLEKKNEEHNKYAIEGKFFSREIDSYLFSNEKWGKPIKLLSADKKETLTLNSEQDLLNEFFTLCSTCHDCVVQISKNEDVINYEGPSPDEICLVSAARQQGYVFQGTTSKSSVVDIQSTKVEFEVVTMFNFDNKRKMMSILLKHNGKYKLLTKGADTAILNNLANCDQPYLEIINDKLHEYSKEGLRTLCMGIRILSPSEVDSIRAETLRIDAHPDKKKILPKFLQSVEKDFLLIGCSAVEDRLQDEVPKVIAELLEADIKVWVLTGDKRETAENIGLSCNLINDQFDLVRLIQKREEETEAFIPKMQESINLSRQKKRKVCTVVEGECLALILKNQERALQYLNMMKDCESVICCRVTPMQKAQVVRLVKKNLGRTALAIGDGANDVNMIQEGDIGVGIFGLEGRQAANSSDFAIPEFKALRRLLFVHGRWSYFRNSEMILYFFYKNMLFTIPQFFFTYLNAYSGKSLFDDWYMTFYNMVFTATPLMIKAILDQEIHYERYLKNDGKLEYYAEKKIKRCMPYFYRIGQEDTIFNNKNFLIWIIQGIVDSFVIWWITTYALQSFIFEGGMNSSYWFKSITMFTSILMVATLKVSFMIRFWTWINVLTVTVFSLGFYFGWIWIEDSLTSFDVYKNQKMVWSSWQFYMIVFINMSWFFCLEYGTQTLKMIFNPDYEIIGKILWKRGRIKTIPEENVVNLFKMKNNAFNQVSGM